MWSSAMENVVIYTSPNCHDCHALKDFLSARGVLFIDKNIEDKFAREELANKYGRLATPTIVIGEKVFLGFSENRQAIEKLLEGRTRGSDV
jgi:glutaredoxin